MTILAIQYLESNPGGSKEIQETVRDKLRIALDMLPISLVLIGWEASEALIQICRQETDKVGARLFRWHPLLTGDGDFYPLLEWQTIGLNGEAVPGFRGMPEFTFVCPNRPAVQEATSAHLMQILGLGLYDGIFLDRIRYPSPAANPAAYLACFCPDCCVAAGRIGLDLAQVRKDLFTLLSSKQRVADLIALLLGQKCGLADNMSLASVDAFLQFRTLSVTNFVARAADLIHNRGLEVGLDTFSPSLTTLVGQDLQTLNDCCEWIKPMIYGHTLGPSGLPFELSELANWLVKDVSLGEGDTMKLLANGLMHQLPETVSALREQGVEPAVIQEETVRGRSAGVECLLAGMELVDLAGVTNLSDRQILLDLQAYHQGGAAGLVLSWDLQLMPREWLALVAAELEKIE